MIKGDLVIRKFKVLFRLSTPLDARNDRFSYWLGIK